MTASLLSFAAVSGMWARSHWRYDAVAFWPDPDARRAHGLISNSGTFWVASLSERGNGRDHFAHTGSEAAPTHFGPRTGLVRRRRTDEFLFGVPYWMLALLPGLLSAASTRRVFNARRLRLREARCPLCGYDLRKAPGGCPECGPVGKA